MADQTPTAPPQYSTDGRWWWDGHQWTAVAASVPAPVRPRPAGRLFPFLMFGIVGAVLVLLAVAAVAGRPPNGEAQTYTTMVQSDTSGMQAPQEAVAACLARQPSPVPCRNQLQALDDQLASFQHDLDRNPAPACLHDSDQELREALRDMRLSAQTAHQAGPFDSATVRDATDALDSATSHLRQAAALRNAASC